MNKENLSNNLAWISGILDAEAYFRNISKMPNIVFVSTDIDVVETVQLFLESGRVIYKEPRKENWSGTYYTQKNSLSLKQKLESIYQYMSKRRQNKIVEILGYVPSNYTYEKLDDIAWLAGYLEGEGSFMKPSPSLPSSPVLQIESTDEDIISRISKILGIKYQKGVKPRKENHKQSWQVRCRGRLAVRWMKKLLPYMSNRRTIQINEAIASLRVNRLTDEQIVDIKVRLLNNEKCASIARVHGTARETISQIKRGLIYNNVN